MLKLLKGLFIIFLCIVFLGVGSFFVFLPGVLFKVFGIILIMIQVAVWITLAWNDNWRPS